MNIVTPSQMAEIDRLTIKEHGLASLTLMENAARSCLPYLPDGKKTTILIGPGNNGGDGLVLARALKENGRHARAVLFDETLSPDANSQLKLAKEWGIPLLHLHSSPNFDFNDFSDSDIIIDALFGTGLTRELEGRHRQAVTWANSSSAHRFSIDIPSGIDGRNGHILGTAFRAHQTVTFGCLKLAHVLYPGKLHCGNIILTQPGFHPDTLQRFDQVQLFTQDWAQRFLPIPWQTMHKGDNGRLLLVTGSARFPGAGILTALGALKGGAGLVTHSCDPQHTSSTLHWCPECIPLPRPQLPDLSKFDAIVVGSGLGDEADSIGLEVIKRAGRPLLLDAESIPYIHEIGATQRAHTLITPHPGELAKLLDCSVEEIEKNRVATAQESAKELGCVVCLKGAPTVTASPDGRAFINSTGNPVLAQGGSGDLLAGIVGALLAYGLPVFEAGATGVYLHGAAADLADSPRGEGAHKIADLVPIAYMKAVGKVSTSQVS